VYLLENFGLSLLFKAGRERPGKDGYFMEIKYNKKNKLYKFIDRGIKLKKPFLFSKFREKRGFSTIK